jgi:hypothetical protein
MRQKGVILLPLILIILFGVTLIIIFNNIRIRNSFFTANQSSIPSTSSPTGEDLTNPTLTDVPAKDGNEVVWKKYFNEKYGFSLNYPGNMIYYENTESPCRVVTAITSIDKSEIIDDGLLTVCMGSPSIVHPNTFYISVNTSQTEINYFYTQDNYTVEKTSINGDNATKITKTKIVHAEDYGPPTVSYYIQRNGKEYVLWYDHLKSDKQFLNNVDNILATFSLTN